MIAQEDMYESILDLRLPNATQSQRQQHKTEAGPDDDQDWGLGYTCGYPMREHYFIGDLDTCRTQKIGFWSKPIIPMINKIALLQIQLFYSWMICLMPFER